ncbi:hypothetical protein LN650_18295 [Klebsiella pneumoniae subsp. pneumoniae]|nr:hypothetical protein [Klebsiella pneumoniae subsp. pneumoniae]
MTVAGKNQKAQFAKDIIVWLPLCRFQKYILSHPQYGWLPAPEYLK